MPCCVPQHSQTCQPHPKPHNLATLSFNHRDLIFHWLNKKATPPVLAHTCKSPNPSLQITTTGRPRQANQASHSHGFSTKDHWACVPSQFEDESTTHGQQSSAPGCRTDHCWSFLTSAFQEEGAFFCSSIQSREHNLRPIILYPKKRKKKEGRED